MRDRGISEALGDVPLERPRPEFVTDLVESLQRELARPATRPEAPSPHPMLTGGRDDRTSRRWTVGSVVAACAALALGLVAVHDSGSSTPSAPEFVEYANGLCQQGLQPWDANAGGPDEQVVAIALTLVDGLRANRATLMSNLDSSTAARTVAQLEQTRRRLTSEADPSLAVRQTLARLQQLGASACDVPPVAGVPYVATPRPS